jgi:hypothetical protein
MYKIKQKHIDTLLVILYNYFLYSMSWILLHVWKLFCSTYHTMLYLYLKDTTFWLLVLMFYKVCHSYKSDLLWRVLSFTKQNEEFNVSVHITTNTSQTSGSLLCIHFESNILHQLWFLKFSKYTSMDTRTHYILLFIDSIFEKAFDSSIIKNNTYIKKKKSQI